SSDFQRRVRRLLEGDLPAGDSLIERLGRAGETLSEIARALAGRSGCRVAIDLAEPAPRSYYTGFFFSAYADTGGEPIAGGCRFSLLRPASADAVPDGRAVRVATKYVRLTRDFFDQKGMAADIVPLSGSVEIAPRMKLADMVADLVDTGETMCANGLVEVEKIC